VLCVTATNPGGQWWSAVRYSDKFVLRDCDEVAVRYSDKFVLGDSDEVAVTLQRQVLGDSDEVAQVLL
jgi:hypothetical protein